MSILAYKLKLLEEYGKPRFISLGRWWDDVPPIERWSIIVDHVKNAEPWERYKIDDLVTEFVPVILEYCDKKKKDPSVMMANTCSSIERYIEIYIRKGYYPNDFFMKEVKFVIKLLENTEFPVLEFDDNALDCLWM